MQWEVFEVSNCSFSKINNKNCWYLKGNYIVSSSFLKVIYENFHANYQVSMHLHSYSVLCVYIQS